MPWLSSMEIIHFIALLKKYFYYYFWLKCLTEEGVKVIYTAIKNYPVYLEKLVHTLSKYHLPIFTK